MNAPIQITVVKTQIGGTLAFVATNPLKNAKHYDENKAIVGALLAAGAIEIVDLDAPKVDPNYCPPTAASLNTASDLAEL